MKQNIDTSQLNQLSDKGKEKLGNWCAKNGYFNPHPTTHGTAMRVVFVIDDPLLSIGQMIEFLAEHTNGPSKLLDNEFEKTGIYASRFVFGTSKNGVFIAYNSDELCDALFEAVKEILEND